MDEELKVLLNRNLEVSEASQKILKKIYADILWRRIFGFIKWGIIIAIFVWSYLQLQPVLKSVLESYQKFLSSPAGCWPNLKLPATGRRRCR